MTSKRITDAVAFLEALEQQIQPEPWQVGAIRKLATAKMPVKLVWCANPGRTDMMNRLRKAERKAKP